MPEDPSTIYIKRDFDVGIYIKRDEVPELGDSRWEQTPGGCLPLQEIVYVAKSWSQVSGPSSFQGVFQDHRGIAFAFLLKKKHYSPYP